MPARIVRWKVSSCGDGEGGYGYRLGCILRVKFTTVASLVLVTIVMIIPWPAVIVGSMLNLKVWLKRVVAARKTLQRCILKSQ